MTNKPSTKSKEEVKVIQVYSKGIRQDRLYPACETSRLLLALTGQQSLTVSQKDLIKQLGYKVQLVDEPKETKEVYL